MVLLDQIWDDTMAGPQPQRGLGMLRKINPKTLNVTDLGGNSKKYQRSMSVPANSETPVTPGTPSTPSPSGIPRDNVWRSVFNPGSNPATKGIGAHVFDKAQPNSPTVYDWLYSGETKSKHR